MARVLGLTRVVGNLLRPSSYERAFDKAMLDIVQEGDSVWDVGANVGHYARKLSEKVGKSGRVFAFEPSAQNLEALRAALACRGNVSIVPLALGRAIAVNSFMQGSDAIGATSRLVEHGTPGSSMVEISTGERLLDDGVVAQPNVIKVDTEGYELDTLQGLGPVLLHPDLRAIGIEVHFALLQERGMAFAPAEIERLLRGAHFAIAWTDSSHIFATRTR